MLPLTPILAILFVRGLGVIGGGAGRLRSVRVGIHIHNWAHWILPVMLAATCAVRIASGRTPRELSSPYDPASTQMFQWMRTETPRDAVVSFFKPRVMHLLGERLAVTAAVEDVRHASYLVYPQLPGWVGRQPAITAYESAAVLTPVFENPGFVVYRVQAR